MKKLNAMITSVMFDESNDLVILGFPTDSEDKKHSCDEAGCGCFDHVLYRNGKVMVETVEESE